MINRHSRLRMRRRLRSHKKQVVEISGTANKQLDRHIFRRWHNLKDARRFMIVWVALLSILIVGIVLQTRALGRYYLEPAPVSGGVYSEGMVGSFTNANPIYAASSTNSSVSRLVFAGLLTYNEQNQLVGDLAASWDVDPRAAIYTVRLKPNLVWQDGKPLTANDVVFTFKTIQNPDAKSPLQSSWANIKVEKVNTTTIKFTLPNAFSPFPHSLITGIIPEHILKNIPVAQLRSASFNNKQPIGAGPFSWQSITTLGVDSGDSRQRIQLTSFDKFRGSPPKLDGITLYTYPDSKVLRDSLNNKRVIGASGLSFNDSVPKDGQNRNAFPENASTMIFLKNSNPILSDVKVRQALVSGTNKAQLIKELGYPVIPVNAPLLKTQVGYNAVSAQRSHDKAEADKLLTEAGWVVPAGKQFRAKNGQELTFNLVSENNSEYTRLINVLQKQWKDIGVKINVSLQPSETIGQSYILTHNYDILMYGINLGPDPDVYPYWHSSQADVKSQGRLNLSEYKSAVADSALEAGRTRIDPQLRAAKYKPFLDAWKNDAPAIGLYQPNYFYLSNQTVYGLVEKTINTPVDRFNNVQTWMINTERTIK